MTILNEGRNCSEFKRVDRLAILVDGQEYYQAFFELAPQARKTINILGWEVDSRLNLSHIDQSFPDDLRDYFNHLVRTNVDLQVSVLSWKSSFYLWFGRERFANLKWKFKTASNVHFKEKRHPHFYGTHHEKIAVIDECCAFLGGMDISRKRWDTSDHELNSPLRLDESGHLYHPIHDVQVICTGDIVEEINHHLRYREMKLAEIPETESHYCWPSNVHSQMRDISVALSYSDVSKKLIEIENLYIDAINSAKRFIYIENQYFSHDGIIEALCHRLTDPYGPEIILVLPYSYRGVFERATYIYERIKAVKKLKQHDLFGRLGIYYPSYFKENPNQFIVVHSKLMIVDDTFMTIGSANLNHRSMKVDSELNLSIEDSEDNKAGEFIEQNLDRFLSEHLGLQDGEFREEFQKDRSLLRTIKTFQGQRKKTLKEMKREMLTPRDRILVLLTPFVDIKYSLPKVHAVIFIATLIMLGLAYMNEVQ